MTDEQKNKIIELRKNGTGYKAIASEIGLSRDAVRSFCKSRNLSGFGVAAVMNISEQTENGNICPNCCKPITQPLKGRRKKFCSEKCRRDWWKEHPEKAAQKDTAQYHLKCTYCGKEFVSYGNKNRKYCSHKCYIKSRFYEEGEYEKHIGTQDYSHIGIKGCGL